jgi:hypothetical protein
VSSAKTEITANVFMATIVVFECGQKRLRLAHFQDDPMELVGSDGYRPAPAGMPEGKFRFQIRRMALLRTDSKGVENMT